MANEHGWQVCYKCSGVFAAKNPNPSECPLMGEHDGFQSPSYVMRLDKNPPQGSGLQGGWTMCQKCSGLIYRKNPDPGVCPLGGKHDHFMSPFYAMRVSSWVEGMEPGFRWCRKCQGMFAVADLGYCPAGGKHDATQSGAYSMRRDIPKPPDPPPLNFAQPLVRVDGKDVSGKTSLTLQSDGTCTLQVMLHDSGKWEYNTSMGWVVWDCWNVPYTSTGFSHSGHVAGTFEPGSRDDNYTQEFHNLDIKDNWSDLSPGAVARAEASAKMDRVNIVNNILSTGLGVAGLVLAVVGAPAAGAAAVGTGMAMRLMKK